MEAVQSTPSPTATPAPVATPVVEATATPSPASESSFSSGGKLSSFLPSKLTLVDYFIAGLYIAVGVYGLITIKQFRKKQSDLPNKEEFDSILDKIDEVEYNVKKIRGKNYETI